MLIGEELVRKLLKVADAYIAHTGAASSTLSKRALGDGADAFGRLRKNYGGITVRKIDEGLCVLSFNWPDDLAWPADVPRPTSAEVKRVLGRPTPRGARPAIERQEAAP